MALQNFYIHTDHNEQEIRNFSLEKLATDPTTPFTGQFWQNTTDNRYRWFDGTTVHTLAHLSDLEAFGALVGTMDASAGIPTTGSGDAGAIRQGDYWFVTTPGTITGINGGSEVLEVGDMVVAGADGATASTDFYAVQTNLDLPTNLTQFEVVTIPAVVANTPFDVFALTTFSNYMDMEVYDSAGQRIELCIDNTGKIESNVALTNLTARVFGSN